MLSQWLLFYWKPKYLSDPQIERQTAVTYSYLEFLWHLSVLTHRHSTIFKCPYLLLQWNTYVAQDNWKSLSRQVTVSNIDGQEVIQSSSVKTSGNRAESNFKYILSQADKLFPVPQLGVVLHIRTFCPLTGMTWREAQQFSHLSIGTFT